MYSSTKSNSGSTLKHPYYPWDLKLKNYVPNDKSSAQILGIFGLIALLIIIIAWVLTGRRKEQFCFMRRVVLCWFLLCAFIHTVLEGYFAVYHATLASHTSFLGQCWKEYAQGDSRYVSSDNFMVCMELITAVIDGPLAFITFFAFLQGSSYRYALQMMLSLFQLYGDGLYFLTEIKAGFIHGPGPKGNPLHFYFYFLALNLLWIVIPIALIIDATLHMANCQVVSDFYIDEYNRKHLKQLNHHKKSK